jgi:transposase
MRLINAFVDVLALSALGIDGVIPEATGRPSYHLAVLLKLRIDVYLNRVKSSQRLEREADCSFKLM